MLLKESTLKKAELINSGFIRIPDNFDISYKISESSAGPDAGSKSIVFSFNNTNVRLKISKNSIYSLNKNEKNLQILKNDKVFIDDVKIVPTLLHAPNQAFINIEHRCKYNCKFCSSPHLKRKKRTKQEIIEKIIEASKNTNFEAVAITAGVIVSDKETTNEIVEIIHKIRKAIGDIIIGVEPCTTSMEDIEQLKESGASEIKLNIQSFDREIFAKICPERDFNEIIESLKFAIKIFGKNNVCSNIIIGLGETNENILYGVEYLAKLGVVPTLRALRIDNINLKLLSKALGYAPEPVPPEQLVFLAEKQKQILENYNLNTKLFKSMCHKCASCDIVPGVDI